MELMVAFAKLMVAVRLVNRRWQPREVRRRRGAVLCDWTGRRARVTVGVGVRVRVFTLRFRLRLLLTVWRQRSGSVPRQVVAPLRKRMDEACLG